MVLGPLAGALQLQHPALLTYDFPQIDGAAIAELTCPVTELMTPVTRSVWDHTFDEPIAGEHLQEIVGLPCVDREAQQLGHFPRVRDQLGPRNGGRLDAGVAAVLDLTRVVAGLGISRKLPHKRVVEDDLVEGTR